MNDLIGADIMKSENKEKKRQTMKNITINIPDIYEENIQKLISMKLIASRSEAIRIAVREYLNREYDKNLDLLGYFDKKEIENKTL